jgi:regulator of nucleoside diphosphate kinase
MMIKSEHTQLIVLHKEAELLKKLIKNSPIVDPTLKHSLKELLEQLKNAVEVNEEDFPTNVVRLNSVVTLQTTYGRKDNLELVLPNEADLSKRKLSVLSPMGAALFGYEEGRNVTWKFPNGYENILIERVLREVSL